MIDLESYDLIRFKYSQLLKVLDFRTGYELNGISFQKKIRTMTGSGESRVRSLSIFREGDISFCVENNRLIVDWRVKLEMLYFISCLFGITSGLMISIFSKSSFVFLFTLGICMAILFVRIGVLIIRYKIDEINQTVLEKEK
jgi:hypothetical protein